MIVAHVHGIPVEEGVLQLLPAAAAIATAIAIAARSTVGQLRHRLRRRADAGDRS